MKRSNGKHQTHFYSTSNFSIKRISVQSKRVTHAIIIIAFTKTSDNRFNKPEMPVSDYSELFYAKLSCLLV